MPTYHPRAILTLSRQWPIPICRGNRSVLYRPLHWLSQSTDLSPKLGSKRRRLQDFGNQHDNRPFRRPNWSLLFRSIQIIKSQRRYEPSIQLSSLLCKVRVSPVACYVGFADGRIDSMTGKFNATVLAQIDASNTTTTASVVSSAGLTKQSASASASKSGVSTTPSAARASGGASSTIALSSGFVLIAGIASYLVI